MSNKAGAHSSESVVLRATCVRLFVHRNRRLRSRRDLDGPGIGSRYVDLSVYLVHYDAADWCHSSVMSILASKQVSVELTVVHNGGERPALPSTVRLIDVGHNAGYAGGANIGLREWLVSGRGEYCMVGSHDLHVGEGTLTTLVNVADARPRVGVLGPSIGDGRRGSEFVERDWVSGTCLLLRRSCLEDVGLFDEYLGSYCEDVDLSRRARAGGWEVGYAPVALAHGLGTRHPHRRQMFQNDLVLRRKEGGWFRVAKGIAALPYQVGRDLTHGNVNRAAARLTAAPSGIWKAARYPGIPGRR